MPEKCTDYPRDCPLISRVEALEEANRQHGATHKRIFEKLEDLKSKTAVQDNQLENIDKKLDDIKDDNKNILAKVDALSVLSSKVDSLGTLTEKVETLEAKPGKRWESLVEKALWAVCAAVIAFLLGRVGL